MRIAIVDYCKGNLRSVQKGLELLGVDAPIVVDPDQIVSADAVVLPGVGAFADAATSMAQAGQDEALREVLAAGKPFLGICLGLHLMFDDGEEGGSDIPGLGFMRGTSNKLPALDEAGNRYKIPHVGWNTVDYVRECPLFDGIPDGTYFYFTHSYRCVPADDEDIVATTTHAGPFCSVVDRGNAFGVQFHPEKSSRWGAAVLANFVKIAERG